MGQVRDTWDPGRYERFRAQRERPALDLLARLDEPVRDPDGARRALDLGCGTGRYTAWLHDRVGATETVGIDSSASMLSEADVHRRGRPGLRFVRGDLQDLDAAGADGSWDVIYANASLQWVEDHEDLIPALVSRLRPGGQLAFQVPANFDHPSHVVAQEVGQRFGLAAFDRTKGVLPPARYAELLHASGLRDLDVSLHIYGHEMARTDEVIDWVSGTLLTSFERRLDAEDFTTFVAEYRRTLLDHLGDPTGGRPYFYAFPRILASGRS